MPNEPTWLTVEQVVELNELIVAETGEDHLVLQPGLLESAITRPRNQWAYDGEDDVVTLAVSLMFAIAMNHPFAQGNKRTGFEAALIFLEANGYRLAYRDDEVLAEVMIKVITRKVSEAQFEAGFRAGVLPL